MKKLAVLALGLFFAACSETPTEPPTAVAPPATLTELGVAAAAAHRGGHGSAMGSEIRKDLAALRAATAAAHNMDQAAAAGWDATITGCLSSPEGAMGVHVANLDSFDEVVEVTQPETLVYEPMKNGRMRLVAVEYIVPFEAHPADAEPPTAFGMDFHANEAVGIWALHVWAWKMNPSGMFADWNPDVTCQWAD